MAIRDSLNRTVRKPFQWGGLQGYQQLQVIATHLQQLDASEPDNPYWRQLAFQVERTLTRNRVLADQLAEAHHWLRRIAACLRYPPGKDTVQTVTGQQVALEMDQLLQELRLDQTRHKPRLALKSRLQYLWKSYGKQLLPCYDIPGLPPDNLQLEAFFNQFRRRQRRISGRKTTRELNRLGHYQALFTAESETELLEHMRQVPYEAYLVHRQRIHLAETHQRFLRGLHRDPENTLKKLVDHHFSQRQLTGRIPGGGENK